MVTQNISCFIQVSVRPIYFCFPAGSILFPIVIPLHKWNIFCTGIYRKDISRKCINCRYLLGCRNCLCFSSICELQNIYHMLIAALWVRKKQIILIRVIHRDIFSVFTVICTIPVRLICHSFKTLSGRFRDFCNFFVSRFRDFCNFFVNRFRDFCNFFVNRFHDFLVSHFRLFTTGCHSCH